MTENVWTPVPLLSWRDLYSLPNFERDPLPPEIVKLGRLAQPYHMPENEELRPCGIQSCKQPHRHGWLILLSDGRKSNAGRCCGESVFGVAWNEQVRSYSLVRRAHTKAEALARRRAEARLAAQQPITAIGAEFDDARAMQASYFAFPEKLRDSLAARAQSSDDVLHDYRAPTAFEVGEAKEKKRPVPTKVKYVVGRLRGLGALRMSNFLDSTIARAAECARELELLANAPSTTADQLSEQLRRLRDANAAIARVPALWGSFFDADNLANLKYLQACSDLKIRAVRLQPGPEFHVAFLN
jgi:hypothetical protein